MTRTYEAKVQCAAKTNKGPRCNRAAVEGEVLCQAHTLNGSQPTDWEQESSPPAPAPAFIPNVGGAPPKFDQEAKDQAVQLAATGMSLNGVARTLGVDRKTIKRHLSLDPTFAEAWQDAYDSVTEDVEQTLVKMALDGHYNAALTVMKARKPEMYSDKKDAGVNIAIGGSNPQVALLSGADLDKQIAETIQELRAAGDHEFLRTLALEAGTDVIDIDHEGNIR